MEGVRAAQPGSSAVVLLDYKMKFEPVRFQETSIEFYGKRGMRWYNSVAIYSRRPTAVSGNNPVTSTDSNLVMMVMDHISLNDSTKELCAVVSTLDAVLSRISFELPDNYVVCIVKDNGRS